jgi:glutamate-1-semialdehyde 2,1-aminomutase
VLRNDTELFMRYRRELVARGIFEMPESLGRSHIGAAHTDDDVDRSLEAAEAALAAALG